MEEFKAFDGVFKVVHEDQLEQCTRDGWKLVRVLPVTVPVGSRTETVVPPTYSGGFSQAHNTVTEYGMSHRFLVQLGADEHVARLNKEISDSQTRQREDMKRLDALAKQQQNTQNALDMAQGVLEARGKTLIEANESIRTLRDKTRRMEEDLGKVRKDLGEREFARITGEPVK